MKKIVSLLLALALMMSLAIPALAADGATAAGVNERGSSEVYVTTVVPEPSYTMVLPAEVEIAYGDTDAEIAVAEVTNVKGFHTGDTVRMTAEHSALMNDMVDSSDWISYDLVYLRLDGGELQGIGNAATDEPSQIAYQHGAEVAVTLAYLASFNAQAWEEAVPGEYSGWITFNYWYVPAEA